MMDFKMIFILRALYDLMATFGGHSFSYLLVFLYYCIF